MKVYIEIDKRKMCLWDKNFPVCKYMANSAIFQFTKGHNSRTTKIAPLKLIDLCLVLIRIVLKFLNSWFRQTDVKSLEMATLAITPFIKGQN